MIIKLQNNLCQYIIGGADNLLGINLDKEIRDYLTVMADGYSFSPAYRADRWDGKIKYVNSKCQFPTGFLETVIQHIESLGAKVEVQDLRSNPIIVKSGFISSVGNKEGWELRDYQIDVLNKTFDKKVGGHPFERGLWFLAPNSGKTSMMVGLMRNIENLNAIVIIDRTINYKQTRDFLKEMFDVGEVSGKKCELDKPVTIAMAKTLSNSLKKFPKLVHELKQKNVIICDEAHRSTSDTYKSIFSKSDAYTTILMSGTLLDMASKPKKLSIIGNAGMVLADVSNTQIIDLGVSLPPKIQIHLNMDGEKYAHLDYQSKYQKSIVESTSRTEQIIDEYYRDSSQIMLVCVRYKSHGELIYNQLVKEFGNTIRIDYSYGDDPFRDEKVDDLKEGNINIFITTSILQESANIPCLTTLFFMQGGKSKIAMKQFYGRVARENGISESVMVHDFWDVGLEESSRLRINYWKSEGFEVEILYPHNRHYSPKLFG